jgi:hypothetical protein
MAGSVAAAKFDVGTAARIAAPRSLAEFNAIFGLLA